MKESILFARYRNYLNYYFHLIRSNVSYFTVLQSWIIFSGVLILLTFQSHIIIVQIRCGFSLFSFPSSSSSNSKALNDSYKQQSIVKPFEYQQCEWNLDHKQYKYGQCVLDKEYDMLLWMVLILSICTSVCSAFGYFGHFWMTAITKINSFDQSRCDVIYTEIELLHESCYDLSIDNCRKILDAKQYTENEQLLPVAIREIIVDMRKSKIPNCQDCGQIICRHIHQRCFLDEEETHLQRMRQLFIFAQIMVTAEIAVIYVLFALCAGICMHCIYRIVGYYVNTAALSIASFCVCNFYFV